MERALLRHAPKLYRVARWAEDEHKLHLAPLVAEFRRLRRKVRHARIVVHFADGGCKRTPTEMTLPLDYRRHFVPQPYFWCRKHGPSSEIEGVTVKLPISFDTIEACEAKTNRAAVHRSVLDALGIRRHRRGISEKFAHDFFANLV